ncbi:MAG: hypothetical protein APZ16_04820 [Candidatus Hadarchaeum yellowstonense]|jgi:hypothetical protein|uniref:Thioredoxin-like fold domain-containing protein n=1 Tax=Hadarchaeum yellowstonense TaxID=1776334 RepID=A0A147JYZ8_HADYE|nr:MAG: hypothetical protein APZ16_04820 [Candidatus Hadarchaeum yellowstonense]
MADVRIEVFVAWPPTSQCKKLIDTVKKVVAEFGERIEVDIYYRGQPYPVEPTAGFIAARKTLFIPAILVDGKVLAEKELPTEETLREVIKNKLGVFT